MFNKINIDTRIKKYNDILTINPYNKQCYLFNKKNNSIEEKKKLLFNKKNFTISYIRESDFLITTFDIGIHNDSDILAICHRRAIEELSLDEEKEYTIKYEEVDYVNNPGVYNVFIIESLLLNNTLKLIVQKTQFLDLILVFPLLFRTLYENNFLEKDSKDCFVYVSKDNTSISIYSEGNFLYSKSIEYSLYNIYEKYCILVSEKISEKEFFEEFENGLKSSNSNFQKNILKIFSEIFLQINDIIIYAKRVFEFDAIDKIFLSSSNGSILGLIEYSNNFLGISSFNFDFNFNIKHKKWYVDQIHYLLILNGMDYIKNNRHIINLTIDKRPPLFLNRASGQLIIAMIILTSLMLIWALVYILITKTINSQYKDLKEKDRQLSIEIKNYKSVITSKQNKLKEISKKKNLMEKKLNIKNETLNFIFNKKVNYRLKSEIFHQIAIDILKYNLYLEKIESNDNTFYLFISSDNNLKITEYINYISLKYKESILDIDLKMIHQDSLLDQKSTDKESIDDKIVRKLDNKYRSILKVVYK